MTSFSIGSFSVTVQALTAGETGFVSADGVIAPVAGVAVTVPDAVLLVEGTMLSSTASAAVDSMTGISDLLVGAGGSLQSARGNAVASGVPGNCDITNAGVIHAARSGIFAQGPNGQFGSLQIMNAGLIQVVQFVGIEVIDTLLKLDNSGEIHGATYGLSALDDGPAAIHNTGWIAGRSGALFLGSGNDTVSNGGALDGAVGLGQGDDRLNGAQGQQGQVDGGDGNDTVIGGAGNKQVLGGVGSDVQIGRAGDDALRGEGGQDSLSGGTGQDRLYGGAGDDLLTGADGRGQLAGGDGDDVLSGGAADDTLTGGRGGRHVDRRVRTRSVCLWPQSGP